jgi:hypothetical protein
MGLLDGSDAAPAKTMIVANMDKTKEPTTVPNPEYGAWVARDQFVLHYLVNPLSREILIHVLRIEHAAGMWSAVEEMFASQSQSKITNLRIALANTKKSNMTSAAFFAKMKGFADELAAARKIVPDDELVSFILAGLGGEYNTVVAKKPMTVVELFSHIQNYEQRQEMLRLSDEGFETSANAASRFNNHGGYRPRNYSSGRDERRGEDRRFDDRRG